MLIFDSKKGHKISIFVLAVPLALSAFTHSWNALGFPVISPDEGVVLERTMHVLNGLGPQEFERNIIAAALYDHPYFGQLFLASIFQISSFPEYFLSFINISVNDYGADAFRIIEIMYSIPRIYVGILAVIDTFLVYHIAQSYYNSKKVSLISATLFAVAPFTYLLRTILLDSILLPFLLLSILFAVRSKRHSDLTTNKERKATVHTHNNKTKVSVILISGIFLGLAIFTKIPCFTMIPLVSFIVFTSTNRSLKILGLWFIPVILVPAIWPIYAAGIGEIDLWSEGVSHQATERIELPLFDKIIAFFTLDPVLLIMGLSGLVYAAIKKDIMLLLWVFPFMLFLYLVGFSLIFHLIPILPAFCIAGSKIIHDIFKQAIHLRSKKKIRQVKIATFVIVSAVLMWELIYTTMLITMDFNSWQFERFSFAAHDLGDDRGSNYAGNSTDTHIENKQNLTKILSNPTYSWIFNYVLH